MKENIYPPMHTAEHILNRTMVRLYDCGRCFSAHIEKKKSKCDYHFDHTLSSDEVEKIEQQVNEIIKNDLPVKEVFISLAEAREKYPNKTFPDDSPQVRIIEVGNYDDIPCIGAHVNTTGEIGHFKIISSDFNDSVLRVRYKLSD